MSTLRLDFDVKGQPVALQFTGGAAPALDGDLRWPGSPLSLAEFAAALGLDHGPAADALAALSLTSARVHYAQADGASTLAIAINDKATLLAWRKDAATLSAVGLDASIGLGDLPIVGSYLRSAGDLRVAGVKAGAGHLHAADVAALAAANPPGLPALRQEDFDSRATLFVTLTLGSGTVTVPLRLDGDTQMRLLAGVPPAPSRPGAWLNVQKQLGPVVVRRVGIDYRDGHAWLLFDGGLQMAGLDIEVDGLALGFTLALPPSIAVAPPTALSVSYTGAVSISGALAAIPGKDGTDYAGQLMLRAANFQITALGAYSNVNGQTSLFAFAVLATPLGGPPAFFVTAIAAGFGFNRALTVPSPSQVPDFPLVQTVMAADPGKTDLGKAKSPADALLVLQRWVQPSAGQSWVAIGVKFNSFRLIDTVALVTARFGGDMAFDLIGLSTLSMPYGDANPIAYAQLALVASIRPSEGVMTVLGQLTPGSYVLSRDCHLTGGFAFAAWFAGPHSGDFVFTLGGYHPRFNRPAHYPDVPRLGAVWNVNSNLSIKGTLYFALTPSAVMAGGAIEAVWQSGDLRAWFSTQTDFLLCWRPFHYEADISVSLGASYRVDLWLTSFTVTVHVGVDVHFWGPPIAGRATVDLSVVTISISFGDSHPSIDPIPWADFKAFMLPKADSGTYCSTRVSGGLLRDLKAADPAAAADWIVDPERIEVVAFSAIPIKTASLTLGTGPGPMPTVKEGGWTQAFGVGPVGIDDDTFGSALSIEVHHLGDDGDLAPEQIHLKAVPLIQSVPAAPWKTSVALDPGLATANDAGRRMVDGALTGFTLVTDPRVPAATVLVGMAPLEFGDSGSAIPVAWNAVTTPAHVEPGADPWHDVRGIAEGAAADARDLIIAALREQEGIEGEVHLTRLAANPEHLLLAAPITDRLGAERKAA